MKKRVLSLMLILVLFSSLFVTSCTKKTDKNNPPDQNTPTATATPTATSAPTATPTLSESDKRKQLKGELNIWVRKGDGQSLMFSLVGGKPGEPFYDYIHSEFPNLVINESPNKGWGDIAKGLASGDLPDIYFWEGEVPDVLAEQVKQGFPEPLDKYLDKDPEFKNSFIPSLLEQHKVNGVTYGLPVDVMPMAVLCNLDLFDQANVPYPTNDWTIDDFNAICKKLTNKSDPTKKRVALARNIDEEDYPRLLNMYFQAYGVKGYKEVDGKKVSNLAEDPNAVTAIEKYLEVYGNNYACTLSGDEKKAMGLDTTIWDVDWEKGAAAMFAASTWGILFDTQAKKPIYKVGVYNAPKGPAGRGTYVSEIGYSIYSGSKNKDLAWEYLKAFSSKEFREKAYTTDPANPGVTVYPFLYNKDTYAFTFGIPAFTAKYDLNADFKVMYDGFNNAAASAGITKTDPPTLLQKIKDVNSGKAQLVDALKEYDKYVNENNLFN